MSCEYCRGEKSLVSDIDEDGGWVAYIRPEDCSMTAHVRLGEEYHCVSANLLLDIEFCPKCGADMADL